MRVIGIKNGLGHGSVILRWVMAGFVNVCLWLPIQAFAAGTFNIYSHRQQILIKPFLDAFTQTTGTETKVVYTSRGLAQRLQVDGAASPADVILTLDIARLTEYANLDLLAPQAQMILDRVGW